MLFNYLFVFLCLLKYLTANFDWEIGHTAVSLSANAYCNLSDYLTRTYTGYSAGFKALQGFEEPTYDTQGYIGVMESQKAIYVIFRGSSSIRDWKDNLDAVLTEYPYCSKVIRKCNVHAGFYKTELQVYPMVYNYLKPIMAKYAGYRLVITGHSLGAALATLFAVDLLEKQKISSKLIHFGSPRVGDDRFVEYASGVITDRSRVTHHKDIVPHCPMHERFTHISGEYYEDDSGLKECTGYEDPTCSYQWRVTSIDDHMIYLGVNMTCGN